MTPAPQGRPMHAMAMPPVLVGLVQEWIDGAVRCGRPMPSPEVCSQLLGCAVSVALAIFDLGERARAGSLDAQRQWDELAAWCAEAARTPGSPGAN